MYTKHYSADFETEYLDILYLDDFWFRHIYIFLRFLIDIMLRLILCIFFKISKFTSKSQIENLFYVSTSGISQQFFFSRNIYKVK